MSERGRSPAGGVRGRVPLPRRVSAPQEHVFRRKICSAEAHEPRPGRVQGGVSPPCIITGVQGVYSPATEGVWGTSPELWDVVPLGIRDIAYQLAYA